MEIADIFVINKSDLPNAEKTVREINAMLDMDKWVGEWRPPVLATNTLENTGINKLWQTLESFREYEKATGLLAEARRAKLRTDLLEIVENEIRLKVQQCLLDSGRLDQELAEVMEGANPYTMAGKFLKDILVS